MKGISRPLTSFTNLNLATAAATVEQTIDQIGNELLLSAETVCVKIKWADVTGTNNGVAICYIERASNTGFNNENTDETSDNPTQRTLSGAAGDTEIFLAPANLNRIKISFAKGTITGGTLNISVNAQF